MALLEIDDVHKHFGGLPAVDGVTLGVDDGEILAIVGPNGAGKSTLLKSIIGLLKPTSGAIRIENIDIAKMSTHRIRQSGVAMVLQTPRVFPSLTVEENVMVGAMFGKKAERLPESAAYEEAGAMLDFVGLSDKSKSAIDQLNLHEQRYVDFARALAGRPKLLLLDEVMAGLNDTETRSSIEMVRTARDRLGVTVIWVEHVMKAVMDLAERVAVLNFGKLLADGDPETVMRDPAVIEAYIGRETLPDA
ncbi:MAG: ABC transporter ATP-binding protein [Acidimicrobiia bacterium]|nr:MAG: ABC transporter ATP-binding protein [Acidimicrobiia bacterium]